MPSPPRNKVYGINTPFVNVFPFPLFKNAAPTADDKSFEVGQLWIYKNGDARLAYIYGGVDSNNDGVWTLSSSSAGNLATLSADSGTASPVAENILISGGSNITTSASGNDVAIALNSSVAVTDVTGGNLKVYVNRIESTNTNGNVILYPNGTGSVVIQGQTANTVATYGTSGALQGVGPLTNGQLLIGSTGAQPVAANLTSTGGSVTITNTAGGINLEASGSSGGTSWSVVTATTASITNGQGLLCNNATGVTVTLPATAAVGDTFTVVAMGGSGTSFSLAVNTGQSIRFGNTFTTTSTGELRSTSLGDVCEVVCSVANTAFIVTRVIGNLTVT